MIKTTRAINIEVDFFILMKKYDYIQKWMQRNRGKQQNRKDQRSSQENQSTKGTFHEQMGTIKDRNDMDLTEAEDIKKKWQE